MAEKVPGASQYNYRDELAENLRREKNKTRRREILSEEKETSAYQTNREETLELRPEKMAESAKQKETEAIREKERAELLSEFKAGMADFEGRIEDTNRLITIFFRGFSEDPSGLQLPESLESVKSRVKDLELRVLDTRGYLVRCSQLLLELRRFYIEMGSRIDEGKKHKEEFIRQIDAVQADLRASKERGLFHQTRSYFDIRKKEQDSKKLEQNVRDENKKIDQDSEHLNSIGMQIYLLEEKMSGAMITEMKRAGDGLNGSIKKLWEGVSGNTLFVEALGSEYIEQFVVPVFDWAIAEQKKGMTGEYSYRHRERKINETLKREVIAKLKNYLVVRDNSASVLQPLREIMSDLPSELSQTCQPILDLGYNGPGEWPDPMAKLFTQYAVNKINTGTGHLKAERAKLPPINQLENSHADLMRRQITDDYYMSFPNSFDSLPYNIKWPISSGHLDYDKLPNMPLWAGARNSVFVREVFGESVDAFDNRCRDKILAGSLTDTDGAVIDKLFYYPTADSVKTLVLLAAADFANYRTTHAFGVLQGLSERPDWTQILDEAEAKYPELKQARAILESWQSRLREDRTLELRDSVAPFAISLLKNESENQQQSRLAKESLSNGKLIEILEASGKISAGDAKSLEALCREIELDHMNSYSFAGFVRDCLTLDLKLPLLYTVSRKIMEPTGEMIEVDGKMSPIYRVNDEAKKYISSPRVVQKIKSWSPEESLVGASRDYFNLFLDAYKYLPRISEQNEIIERFCEDFKGQETIDFYEKVSQAFGETGQIANHSGALGYLLKAASQGKITQDRVLEFSKPIQTKRGEFSIAQIDGLTFRNLAWSYPGLILQDNDGLDFLSHLNERGLNALDVDLDFSMGRKYVDSSKNVLDPSSSPRSFSLQVFSMTFGQKTIPSLVEGSEINSENWKDLMMAFIGLSEGAWGGGEGTKEASEQIKKIFESNDAKDLCLNEMKKLWVAYLERGEINDLPFSLNAIIDYVKKNGGAGPLSQIESLCLFIDAYRESLFNNRTVTRTKNEIMKGLASAERRFKKERWSNENMADFYNISRDVMAAAPSLFSAYFKLFEKLKPKDFKDFSQDIFPLHRVVMSLSEKRDKNGDPSFDKKDLVKMRKYVAGVSDESGQLKSVEKQKEELMKLILAMFKEKFGVIKVPQNLDHEHVRSLTDVSMYLSNLAGKNEEENGKNETILSFYLALVINDKWNDYRRGLEINPEEFLESEKAEQIKSYLEQREKLNPVIPKNIGIDAKEMAEFNKILQEESENVTVGNVETVDVKLNNVIYNLRGLQDLDLYPDPMDKKRMALLFEYGNKKIGAVSARMYQQLAKPGKEFQFSEDDGQIKSQIESIMSENGVELTAENIKKYFQDEIKPLAVVANILHFIEEIGVEKEIAELQEILKPSEGVIAVFNKIGEEFKLASGAVAISQDLEYLDNLVVKKASEMNESEMQLVKTYILKVREKLTVLENIYDQVGKKFASIKQGQAETKNQILRGKLEDISKVIDRPESQQIIASTMTNSLTFIIENMRECLSCVRQGANNDTNLTFGDQNKFYLYSKSDLRAGSISDEIVFFEPVKFSGSGQQMAFVFDRIYGTNTPAILVNQIETVYKKYTKIKRQFPNAKISVFVSDAAISAGSISRELLIGKLKEKIGAKLNTQEIEEAEVDVVQSASGDHYVEFGGGARDFGKRQIGGVLLM